MANEDIKYVRKIEVVNGKKYGIATSNKLTFKTDGAGWSEKDANFDGSRATEISYNSIGAASSEHTHANLTFTTAEGDTSAVYNGKDAKTVGYKTIGAAKNDHTHAKITFNDGTEYNGSQSVSINYETVGAANVNHKHDTNDIETGMFSASVLPKATEEAAGITKLGADGGAATYYHTHKTDELAIAEYSFSLNEETETLEITKTMVTPDPIIDNTGSGEQPPTPPIIDIKTQS